MPAGPAKDTAAKELEQMEQEPYIPPMPSSHWYRPYRGPAEAKTIEEKKAKVAAARELDEMEQEPYIPPMPSSHWYRSPHIPEEKAKAIEEKKAEVAAMPAGAAKVAAARE